MIHHGPAASRTQGHHARGGIFTGARPLAAPGHGSSPAGAEKREESTGIPFWASPELGRQCGCQTMTVKRWQKRGGGCGENRQRHLPFILVVGQCREVAACE
jgi:hypothetical protein